MTKTSLIARAKCSGETGLGYKAMPALLSEDVILFSASSAEKAWLAK